MPTKTLIVMTILLACISANSAVGQAVRPSSIACGIRQYNNHPEDETSPFGDGDLSYLLAYEYREAKAYWQFGVSFTPHATATSLVERVESVITPQVRLIFEENLIMMGIGIFKHYVRGEEANHWSSMYWEFTAGLHTPITSVLELRGLAYYTFREWGDVGDFKTNQIELGLELSYRF